MEYLSKKKIRPYREQFNEIVNKLKEKLGSGWSFQYYLVGSARRNMVFDGNEGFDLDYHFKLNYWPAELSDEDIKREFRIKLDDIVPYYDLSYCEDSTHVLTTKYIEGTKIIYSYDIAIIKEEVKSQILKNEKDNSSNGPYHFVDIPNSSDFISRYKLVTGPDMWNDLRKNYKEKKESQIIIRKDDRILSFSLFISSVNEILQKYRKI